MRAITARSRKRLASSSGTDWGSGRAMGPPTRQGPPASASTRVLALEGAKSTAVVTPRRQESQKPPPGRPRRKACLTPGADVTSPSRALGFDSTRYQPEPPVCYRASWQLPRTGLPPASDDEHEHEDH